MRIERKAFLPAVCGSHTDGSVYPELLLLCSQQKEQNTPQQQFLLGEKEVGHTDSQEKLQLVSKTAYTNHLSFTKCKGEQGARGAKILKNSGNLLTGWQCLLLVSRQ